MARLGFKQRDELLSLVQQDLLLVALIDREFVVNASLESAWQYLLRLRSMANLGPSHQTD